MRILVPLLSACGFVPGQAPADGAAGASDTRPLDTGLALDSRVVVDAPADARPDAPGPAVNVFTSDNNTLALFEMNGDLADSSGNGRDATLIGGTFVPSSWGMALSLPGTATQGFTWGYPALLVHPFTVELVVTPKAVDCWHKLFGVADAADAGWYYCAQFQAYPANPFGPNLTAGQRHYFAIVSTASNAVDVYLNGTKLGSSASFATPPGSAIFFRDDTNTQRSEEVNGPVEAVRISKIARTSAEITAVAQRLATQP